jgi:A/G-specific adenine glycosylase
MSDATFAARLLRWFDVHRRDLPWRRTRDPWAIWVSEIMLQQTRVEAVREPYARFLARFPTPAAFAAASDDDLLVAWRGLGYYRRARFLREGAREVVAAHGGAVPHDVTALGRLPGIGDYTRGAVASIAFGHAEVAVDGNVERVTARHLGLREAVENAEVRRTLRRTVGGWMDRDRPGDFNQALMELGATLCTPQSPRCATCPVAEDCRGCRAGIAAELPVRKPPRAATEVSARVVVVSGRGGVLGHRVASGEANAGQVELPGAGMLQSVPVEDLSCALQRRFGAKIEIGPELCIVRHAITWHRITLHAHAAVVREPGELSWFALHGDVPWTTPSRKVFRGAFDGSGELRA